jgi:hypothetical protein
VLFLLAAESFWHLLPAPQVQVVQPLAQVSA